MPTCAVETCGRHFSSYHRVGDKVHRLVNRKYCLSCSPFGHHNTKKIDKGLDRRRTIEGPRICSVCGQRNTTPKGTKCGGCSFRRRKSSRAHLVYSVVGTACWHCAYDKGYAAHTVLEWHHVIPAEKLFGLTTRELAGHTWALLRCELQKCVLLCCRCHREHHAGLISSKELRKLQEVKWRIFGPLLPF
jgi:hypothetical protein